MPLTFDPQVLVELRQWGQDQNAISAVYKALLRTENLDPTNRGPAITELGVGGHNHCIVMVTILHIIMSMHRAYQSDGLFFLSLLSPFKAERKVASFPGRFFSN